MRVRFFTRSHLLVFQSCLNEEKHFRGALIVFFVPLWWTPPHPQASEGKDLVLGSAEPGTFSASFWRVTNLCLLHILVLLHQPPPISVQWQTKQSLPKMMAKMVQRFYSALVLNWKIKLCNSVHIPDWVWAVQCQWDPLHQKTKPQVKYFPQKALDFDEENNVWV